MTNDEGQARRKTTGKPGNKGKFDGKGNSAPETQIGQPKSIHIVAARDKNGGNYITPADIAAVAALLEAAGETTSFQEEAERLTTGALSSEHTPKRFTSTASGVTVDIEIQPIVTHGWYDGYPVGWHYADDPSIYDCDYCPGDPDKANKSW